MENPLARLKGIGFIVAGVWKLNGEGIIYELNELATARNVLYAFVVDGELMYVGKTVQPLHTRMAGYKCPGNTQSTNIRNNQIIR